MQVVAATVGEDELGIWRGGEQARGERQRMQDDDKLEGSRVAPADNGRCRQASQRVLSRVEGESRYHGVVLWPLGLGGGGKAVYLR